MYEEEKRKKRGSESSPEVFKGPLRRVVVGPGLGQSDAIAPIRR